MKRFILALVLSACAAQVNAAAISTYTTEAGFLNATTPSVFENFDDEASVDGVVYSIQTDVFNVVLDPFSGPTPLIRISEGPDKLLGNHSAPIQSSSGKGYTLTFTLFQPVTSLAVDIYDGSESTANGQQSSISVEVLDSGPLVVSTCPPCLPNQSWQFFGLVASDSFTQFKITSTAWGDGVGYDNFQFTAVPIPAAAWLFGSALGLLGWISKKSSK